MTTIDLTHTPAIPITTAARPPGRVAAYRTLVRRRFALSARTPREVLVPLFTPVLFALVIAPALAATVGKFLPGIDYQTYVSVATVGLLIPLTMMFAGVSVILKSSLAGLTVPAFIVARATSLDAMLV